jgi:hypothetical protein
VKFCRANDLRDASVPMHAGEEARGEETAVRIPDAHDGRLFCR